MGCRAIPPSLASRQVPGTSHPAALSVPTGDNPHLQSIFSVQTLCQPWASVGPLTRSSPVKWHFEPRFVAKETEGPWRQCHDCSAAQPESNASRRPIKYTVFLFTLHRVRKAQNDEGECPPLPKPQGTVSDPSGRNLPEVNRIVEAFMRKVPPKQQSRLTIQ